MKQLFLFVLAIFSLTASAQGLGLLGDRRSFREQRRMRELERQRQEDAKKQLLGEQMPFTNAVARAKAGDGAGLFALAIYVSQGKEVQTNGKLAYKYLCAAADAGDANAIFVKHLLEERKTENGSFRARNLDSYIGRCTFDCTNRFCEGRIDVGRRDIAEKLLAQYRADFERGVAAATNEIARIEAEIKLTEKYKKQKLIADEKRKRNAELLASEMGDKVVSEEQDRVKLIGEAQSLREKRRRFEAEREEHLNQLMQEIRELRESKQRTSMGSDPIEENCR